MGQHEKMKIDTKLEDNNTNTNTNTNTNNNNNNNTNSNNNSALRHLRKLSLINIESIDNDILSLFLKATTATTVTTSSSSSATTTTTIPSSCTGSSGESNILGVGKLRSLTLNRMYNFTTEGF